MKKTNSERTQNEHLDGLIGPDDCSDDNCTATNTITINGKSLKLAGKTLAEYLAEAKYDPKRIAVELNGEIVPKAMYETTVLHDGDCVEIVSFVGGG